MTDKKQLGFIYDHMGMGSVIFFQQFIRFCAQKIVQNKIS